MRCAHGRAVIPGGMYGHQNAAWLPERYSQFFESGKGCRIRDVDGDEYIDLYLHPWHAMFLSAALADEDIRAALEITDLALAKLRQRSGGGSSR